jgi:hypothetical protein
MHKLRSKTGSVGAVISHQGVGGGGGGRAQESWHTFDVHNDRAASRAL